MTGPAVAASWEQRTTANRAQLEALQDLARDARRNLADPTPQDQRRIYELLQLQITATEDRTLDITGSILTHGLTEPQETRGKASQGVPRDSGPLPVGLCTWDSAPLVVGGG